eukprot:s4052_g6.t1
MLVLSVEDLRVSSGVDRSSAIYCRCDTNDNDCFNLYRSIVYHDDGLSSNSSSPSEPSWWLRPTSVFPPALLQRILQRILLSLADRLASSSLMDL